MRVEIELAKLLFHFGKPVRAETASNQWAAGGGAVDPVPILGQREQGAPSFVLPATTKRATGFVSPYTDS